MIKKIVLKTIIIENEKFHIRQLQSLIEEINEDKNLPISLDVISVEGSKDKGTISIREHKPDLVFLDIEIKGGTGFDILDETIDLPFDVIITTGYSDHVPYINRLIDINTLLGSSTFRWMSKPIDFDLLKVNLRLLASNNEKSTAEKKLSEISKDVDKINRALDGQEKILILSKQDIDTGFSFLESNSKNSLESETSDKEIVKVKIKDIIKFEIAQRKDGEKISNYCVVHYFKDRNGIVEIEKSQFIRITISAIENHLCNSMYDFIKTGRGLIINLHHIQKCSADFASISIPGPHNSPEVMEVKGKAKDKLSNHNARFKWDILGS